MPLSQHKVKVSNNKLKVSKITFGAAVFSGWHNHIEEVWPSLSVRRALELGSILYTDYFYSLSIYIFCMLIEIIIRY